jgi:predicted DNA-binding transcriptional regulator AlpA
MTSSPPLPEWMPRRLISVPEVAELIDQSERQVWRYIADGRLQVIRLGNSVKATPEAVVALLGLL